MKKSLIILFLFYFVFSKAQISFEKGYFITNSDQRIDCFIKNVDWRNNPNDFSYKINDGDSNVLSESILNVKEFGITNFSKYIRYKVNIENSSNNINSLTDKKNPLWKEEQLFLEVIIEGNASLYAFTRKDQTKFFYETKNIPLEQLVMIKYYADDTRKDYKINFSYRQQLFTNLISESLSEKDFNFLDYDKKQLVKIFNKYNNTETSVVFENKKNRKSLNLKITPSLNFATLKIIDLYNVPNINYKQSEKNFKIGFELEYYLPFNKNIWSVFINPGYENFNSEGNFSSKKIDNFGNLVNTNFYIKSKYSSIEVPIGIRYYFFFNKNSRMFIDAGLSFIIQGKSDISFDNNINLTGRSSTNLVTGLGYSFKKKFSLELRYNSSREILYSYIYWSTKYSSYGVVLGYTIF